MIQVLLISLLQLFVSFLEEAFSTKSYYFYQDSHNNNNNNNTADDHDDHDFFRNDGRGRGSKRKKSKSQQEQNNKEGDDHDDYDYDDDDDPRLRQAYEFLELTPPSPSSSSSSSSSPGGGVTTTTTTTTTMEQQVRKQWKRLSLRYHPDRNQGSEESHAMQQKLNEAMNRVLEALEERKKREERERKGSEKDQNDDDDDDDDDEDASSSHSNFYSDGEEEEEEEEEEENFTPPKPAQRPAPTRNHHHHQQQQHQPPPRSSNKSWRRGPASRRNNNNNNNNNRQESQRERKEEAKRKRQEEMRQELQRELEEEQRRERKEYQKIEEEQWKIRRETLRLHDPEQREAANRFFMDQVHLHQRRRRRQQQRRRLSNPSNSSSFQKPKHYVMESCTNDLVVAMRLGMDELAVRLLDKQVNHQIQACMYDREKMYRLKRRHGAGWITQQHLVDAAMPLILLQPLDDDRNSLLHYAVYWERSLMVRILCELAQHSGLLEEVFLAKNCHGCIPMDLAWIATRDPSILSYLQNQQQVLQIQLERTRMIPALSKAARQLWEGLRSKFDLLTAINTFLVYRIGRSVFSLHWTIACLGIAIFQSPRHIWALLQQQDQQEKSTSSVPVTSSAPFMSFLTSIRLTLSWLSWIYAHGWSYLKLWVRWELLLIVAPVALLCGCCQVVAFVELPIFMWSWASVTLIYYPFQMLEQAIRKWVWGRYPTVLRRRPGLAQTMILFSVLVVSAMIRAIALLNEERFMEPSSLLVLVDHTGDEETLKELVENVVVDDQDVI